MQVLSLSFDVGCTVVVRAAAAAATAAADRIRNHKMIELHDENFVWLLINASTKSKDFGHR